MSSVSSKFDGHEPGLPNLGGDNEARQRQSTAKSLEDQIPSVGAKGPPRSEWRHTVWKDMLAFFILGIIVGTVRPLSLSAVAKSSAR